MGMFANPLSHAGYPPGVTGTPTTQPSEVRAATAAEAAAGTLTNVYISPATAQSATALDFASPPVLGFGSTTPRPVHATTLDATGTVGINTSGAGVTTIGTGGTGATNIGNATGNTAVTGSLGTTTTLTAGTGLIATTGGVTVNGGDIINSHSDAATDVTIEVTNSDNTSGTSRAGVEIATGGSSSGDPYLSFQISGVGASTMTMGLDNSASDTFVISNSTTLGTSNALTLTQAGALDATTSITAGTTLTATLGDVTATNGNFVSSTAGKGLSFNANTATGAAASPVVLDSRAGQVVFSSVSIAAAADLTLTITNSAITGASTQVIYSMSGATTGAALCIKSVTNSAGSSAIVVTNGTGATTSTADITLTFIVVN